MYCRNARVKRVINSLARPGWQNFRYEFKFFRCLSHYARVKYLLHIIHRILSTYKVMRNIILIHCHMIYMKLFCLVIRIDFGIVRVYQTSANALRSIENRTLSARDQRSRWSVSLDVRVIRSSIVYGRARAQCTVQL